MTARSTRVVCVFRITFLTLALVMLVQLTASADTITLQWNDSGSGSLYDNIPGIPDEAIFSNTSFQITATGDTASIQPGCLTHPLCSYLNLTSVSMFVSDLTDASGTINYGSATFDFGIGMRIFVDNTNAPYTEGFSIQNLNGDDLYTGPGLSSTWFLTSSIGPISGPTSLPETDWEQAAAITGTVTQTCQVLNNCASSGYALLPSLVTPDQYAINVNALTTYDPSDLTTQDTDCGNNCVTNGTFQAVVTPTGVPEPSSILLLVFGLAGAFFVLRRRSFVI